MNAQKQQNDTDSGVTCGIEKVIISPDSCDGLEYEYGAWLERRGIRAIYGQIPGGAYDTDGNLTDYGDKLWSEFCDSLISTTLADALTEASRDGYEIVITNADTYNFDDFWAHCHSEQDPRNLRYKYDRDGKRIIAYGLDGLEANREHWLFLK